MLQVLRQEHLETHVHVLSFWVQDAMQSVDKEDNKDLKQDDAFNTMWWSVLSVDNCCQVTSLSMERTGHNVLLKASSCLRSLISCQKPFVYLYLRFFIKTVLYNISVVTMLLFRKLLAKKLIKSTNETI